MKLILFSVLLFSTNALKTYNLNGDWMVKDKTGEYSDIPAIVPGGIYSDLMRNNIIDDIYSGYNDVNTKWVPRRNWTYYRTFKVDDDLVSDENTNLVFEGLDTFASVFLNGKYVGQSRNMFVRYIFDIREQLQIGENSLEVQFLSPIEVAQNLHEEQAKQYVVPPTCPPDEYRGECHVNMIRKMQASYSWDWGPSFPSVGIWKDLYIESFNESAIRYLGTETTLDGDTWNLDVDVYFSDNVKHLVEGTLEVILDIKNRPVSQTVSVSASPNKYGEIIQRVTLQVSKNNVDLWWPNTYGAPTLYNLTAIISSKTGEQSSKSVRVGFRTIELVQEQLGNGLSFYFKINDKPIFAKGSNEIPLDILPERGQDRDLIYKTLYNAQDYKMNMIRVWGGGVYESDYFYDLADEFGILIWQDFMFACAMYPSTDDYLENVKEEIRHQVNRLRSHPSIALFAGNNENEGALRQNWYGTEVNFDQYYNDYVKLYVDTVQAEYERITDKKKIFLTSSPSNGEESISEGYVAQNPGDYNYGDVHFYNYVQDPWDSNIYPVSRFSSEYGYQALPNYNSLLRYTTNISDLDIDSVFMDHRQHHPDGNSEMKELIEFNMKLPERTHANYSKAFIYYSQIAQAQAIRIETEHYRRYRSFLNSDGLGNTMGALYWQLNDVWLAPTWASTDFSGQRKMLDYFVKKSFDTIIITGHINQQRGLDIYVVSDSGEDVQDATGIIYIYRWDSFETVYEIDVAFDLVNSSSNLIKTIDNVDSGLADYNCGTVEDAKYNCFFALQTGQKTSTPDNYVFPAPLKDSALQKSNVKITSITTVKPGTYNVIVEADNISLFVWFETKYNGKFSDNGFLMINKEKSVIFVSEDEYLTLGDFSASLSVTHLMDQQYL